jgi:hypothetical protein
VKQNCPEGLCVKLPLARVRVSWLDGALSVCGLLADRRSCSGKTNLLEISCSRAWALARLGLTHAEELMADEALS